MRGGRRGESLVAWQSTRKVGDAVLSAAFYIVPLAPGGIFLGTLLLLLIVPVFAMAALALALIAGLLALAAAVATAPAVLARAVRHRPRPAPSLDAVRRARRLLRRIPARRQTSPGREEAHLDRARQLG